MSDVIEEAKKWSSYIKSEPMHIWHDEADLLDMVDSLIKELEQCHKVVAAAEKLAEVKHHKDHKGKDDWYEIHQPAAWVRLFEALSQLKSNEDKVK